MTEWKQDLALGLSVGSGLVTTLLGLLAWSSRRWVERVDTDIEKLRDAQNAITPRLAALEARASETVTRLDRIEGVHLNRIEDKLDKLISGTRR